MQKIIVEHCIKTYIDDLKEKYKNAHEGKNPNCIKCDEFGEVEIKVMNRIIKTTCSCFENNKASIEKKIYEIRKLYDNYFMKFGSLDDDLTLDRYAMLFDRAPFIDLLKNYLINNLPFSILLSGQSASGKTTILKIIYQVLILNNINVYYFSCADFENYSSTLHMNNIDDKKEVRKMIALAKSSKIVLMDDHLCLPNKNCLAGYYNIFDYMRAYKKTLIMASNKTHDEIVSTYFSRDAFMADRLATRLAGLNLVEITTSKCEAFYATQT